MTTSLVLYVDAHWCSPWTGIVHVGLREKQLTFSTAVAMVRPGVGAVDAMHDRTITGTAPVLQAGPHWLAESQAIIEYLEEAFPPPAWPRLLPADLVARARARQLMGWNRFSHDAFRRERPMERLIYRTTDALPPLSPAARHSVSEILRVANRFTLSATSFLFSTFTIADVDFALTLWRLTLDAALPPHLAGYVDTVLSRPAVREFLDHPRPPFLPPME
jgi:glutathione S-transferase